jgi:hypothetical protein
LPSDFLLIHLVTDRAITTADDFAVHAGFSSCDGSEPDRCVAAHYGTVSDE